MDALTLTEPFASFMAFRLKRIETRGWQTGFRGTFAIHAAKTFNGVGGKKAFLALCHEPLFAKALTTIFPGPVDNAIASIIQTLGCVLATGYLYDCATITSDAKHGYIWRRAIRAYVPVSPAERAFGLYEPGRYGFCVDRVARLATPIPASGAQMFWTWDAPLPLIYAPTDADAARSSL